MFPSSEFEISIGDILPAVALHLVTKVLFYCHFFVLCYGLIVHSYQELRCNPVCPISQIQDSQSLLISLSFYFHSLFASYTPSTITDGKLFNRAYENVTTNEWVDDGDEWSMEVDLRSAEKEKRTIHWFVNGDQQLGFIKGLPDTIEFGV